MSSAVSTSMLSIPDVNCSIAFYTNIHCLLFKGQAAQHAFICMAKTQGMSMDVPQVFDLLGGTLALSGCT